MACKENGLLFSHLPQLFCLYSLLDGSLILQLHVEALWVSVTMFCKRRLHKREAFKNLNSQLEFLKKFRQSFAKNWPVMDVAMGIAIENKMKKKQSKKIFPGKIDFDTFILEKIRSECYSKYLITCWLKVRKPYELYWNLWIQCFSSTTAETTALFH